MGAAAGARHGGGRDARGHSRGTRGLLALGEESAPRLDELARALGHWASEFLPLPGKPAGLGLLPPSRALGEFDVLPDELRRSRGLITTELKDLVGFEPFSDVIDLVDTESDASTFMPDLLATFAGTYVNSRSGSFEFLHAVTGAAAVTELLPLLRPEDRPPVRAYIWQATAALYARFGTQDLTAHLDDTPTAEHATAMAQRAVASRDEHTIKLVAACTRAWNHSPDPRLLAAAARRTQRLR